MQLVLTPEAKADIAQAVAWYRDRSTQAADKFLLAVGVAFSRIEANPTSRKVVDAPSGARRALLRKYPQRVFYLVEGESIVVFAVIHHRRNDPIWRKRLG